MQASLEQFILILEVTIFICVILMNLVKKNSNLVFLYVVQSLALVVILGVDAYTNHSIELAGIALLVFAVKVLFAPYFFYRFVRRSRLNVSTSTYLNVPMTLTALLGIIIFCNSDVFYPLNSFIPHGLQLPMMLFSSIFMSIFILINRKGSLSQIIGILSVENSIVVFGFFLGLTQSLAVEVGIMFNVLVWVVLATLFIELLHRHLGPVDVTELQNLKK